MHHPNPQSSSCHHHVVVIGGGTAGIAMAASLLKRRTDLDIAIVEPAEMHSYQPAWTMVGGGVFSTAFIRRPVGDGIPDKVNCYAVQAERVDPQAGEVVLGGGRRLNYSRLVVAPWSSTGAPSRVWKPRWVRMV